MRRWSLAGLAEVARATSRLWRKDHLRNFPLTSLFRTEACPILPNRRRL